MPATVKVLERKPLSFLQRTYLPGVLAGLRTTFRHLVAPKVTMEYPDQRPPIQSATAACPPW